MTETHRPEPGKERVHPTDAFLKPESFPSVWCPGCGIGTALYCFLEAGREAGISPEQMRVVTGIGCTGAVSECLGLESSPVTETSPVRFAVELEQKNPESKIAVFLNNADWMRSGGVGLREAGRRKSSIMVIAINNLVYAVSRENASPMTPYMRKSADGRFDLPFNLPEMACAYGADFVARWTPLRAGWLKDSLTTAFSIQTGPSLLEVISPCLLFDVNGGRILDSVERMKFYNDFSEIRFWTPPGNLDLRRQKRVYLGVFRDGSRRQSEERP